MAGITSMVVKDFNRDGFADIAITVSGQNAILVLIGKVMEPFSRLFRRRQVTRLIFYRRFNRVVTVSPSRKS